jgi:hypothetical protein
MKARLMQVLLAGGGAAVGAVLGLAGSYFIPRQYTSEGAVAAVQPAAFVEEALKAETLAYVVVRLDLHHWRQLSEKALTAEDRQRVLDDNVRKVRGGLLVARDGASDRVRISFTHREAAVAQAVVREVIAGVAEVRGNASGPSLGIEVAKGTLGMQDMFKTFDGAEGGMPEEAHAPVQTGPPVAPAVRVIEAPGLPAQPSSVGRGVFAAAGAFAGLLLGLAFLYLTRETDVSAAEFVARQ